METEIVQSRAAGYIESKGWSYKQSGVDQAAIENCPCCNADGYKFYMNIGGGAKDGLFDCKKCGEKGSLFQLQSKLGDKIENVTSLREVQIKQPPPLPDVMALSNRLRTDEDFADALDYLVAERGYTMPVIEAMKLGAQKMNGKTYISIPHFTKGVLTYVKFRNIAPTDKNDRFISSEGREAGLYNRDVIRPEMDFLILVEGEGDVLAAKSAGMSYVVGIPGANMKKASWLTLLDEAKPRQLYLLYDNDKVGQKAAKEMAKRIDQNIRNIVLPPFTRRDGEPGKDLNEWFRAGNTVKDLEKLMQEARMFDVDGVQNLADVGQELIEDIENHGSQRYELDTPWPSLTKIMGGFNYGEVVGIIAEGKVGKTTLCLNWLDYYVAKGIPSFMLCLEMLPKALVRKWISYKTQTDDTLMKKEHVVQGLEIAKSMPADLLFGYTKADPDTVFDMIRLAVRRYGIKVVAFDNLQFLVRSLAHTAQETANMSKRFKELAMELNILILLVVQPNRVREGEIVSARNANGSSAIEKDVDAMLALHRNRVGQIKAGDFNGFLEAEANFEPQLLCRADLTRYASGGVCTLWMQGEVSTVRELSDEDHKNVLLPKMDANMTVLDLKAPKPEF